MCNYVIMHYRQTGRVFKGENLLLRAQSPHIKHLRNRSMGFSTFLFVCLFGCLSAKLWTSQVPWPESPIAAGVH